MSHDEPPRDDEPPRAPKRKSRVLSFAIAGMLLGGLFGAIGALGNKDREQPENQNPGYFIGTILGGLCCPGLIGAGIGWLVGPAKEGNRK
jgi:hypothetical protein